MGMTKAWGYEYRSTTVCVDSYEDGVLAGLAYTGKKREEEEI